MVPSTLSSTGYPYAYAPVNSGSAGGSGVLRALEDVPGKIVTGVEDVGEAVGDAASATVSFSERAMSALANGAMDVVHGVEDVLAYPLEAAADLAVGVEHAVQGGVRMLGDAFNAVVDGAESAARGAAGVVHAVAVELPETIASDMSDVTQAALNNAGSVATAAAGVAVLTGTSPMKVISSVI